jgi:hypothetical protein
MFLAPRGSAAPPDVGSSGSTGGIIGQIKNAIAHRQARFADKWNASVPKLDGKRRLIHRFKKTASELTVDRHPGADDFVGLRIVEDWP